MKWKLYQKKCSQLELDISKQELPQLLCCRRRVYHNSCVSEKVFITLSV